MDRTGWVMPTHIIAGAGVVINDKDEVLMVKTYNAGWVFPGGQVEVGENVIDAVKREIMEETGIDVDGILHFLQHRKISRIQRGRRSADEDHAGLYM